jgi:hypothetical protein
MKTKAAFILMLILFPSFAAPGLTVLRNPIFTFDSQQTLAGTYVVPPDMCAAVGPENYVCVDNRVITWSTKAGGGTVSMRLAKNLTTGVGSFFSQLIPDAQATAFFES